MENLTPPLAALLPPPGAPVSADELLSRFLQYTAAAKLALYPAQEEAILELFADKHVVLNTPTGSGKSLVATALHFKALAEGKLSFYTCPIKALANEKFFALCELFGPGRVGLYTGDATINREAGIVVCTAEILSNLALREAAPRVDSVVMDEFHYYGDKERGVAWQIPLLALPRTQFLLMSATLGDTEAIEKSLTELTQRATVAVRGAERPVPLDFEYVQTPLHETLESLVAAGKHPIYLVNFTQRAAAEQAQNLMSVNFSSKEDKEAIRQALDGVRFDSPYGKDFQRFLRHGIGLHHAGLLPKYRHTVERLAQQGLLKVVSGTDTLGMGVNIPIRTVVFTQLCKFDGTKTGILSVREFLQIAGRAGRKGFDDRGSVVVQAPEHVIENLKLSEKQAAGKKVVKKQPPQKGYVHWDKTTFDRLLTKPPEPLESRFDVTHGMLLSLIQGDPGASDSGYRRGVRLIQLSHTSEHVKRQLLKKAAAYLRTLVHAGLVLHIKGTPHLLPRLEVAPGLQRDFSLHQTLSLYLLETLPKLDAATEGYALNVLSLVEAILENPDVVLYKQLDALKGEKVNELKAQGVDYADRMAELEKLEYPKPNRDFTYTTFNAFAEKHPWVGEENIRPKSVARDMFERCASFADYVREYEIQRSEGVLLRYLTDSYKTLSQTVPEANRTDELEDILAFLRTTLRTVDSSLLDEWEAMQAPEGATPAEATPVGPIQERVPQLSDNPKALAIRVRNELHRLLKALSSRDWVGALACLRPGSEWTEKALEEALAPYFEEYGRIDVTPRARKPEYTLLSKTGPKLWEVRQRILDPEGHGDWMLDTVVDLSGSVAPEGPLLALQRIGL
jgi:superfamily II RNA helicase